MVSSCALVTHLKVWAKNEVANFLCMFGKNSTCEKNLDWLKNKSTHIWFININQYHTADEKTKRRYEFHIFPFIRSIIFFDVFLGQFYYVY